MFGDYWIGVYIYSTYGLKIPYCYRKMYRVLLWNIYTQFCLSQQVLKVRVHMTICVSFPSDDFLSDSLFGDMFISFILSMILALPCCYWSVSERMVKRGSSEQGLRNHTTLWSALSPWPGAHHLSSFSLSIFLSTTVCVKYILGQQLPPTRWAINSSHWYTAGF